MVDHRQTWASALVGVILGLMVTAWWYLSAEAPVTTPLLSQVEAPPSGPATAVLPASAATRAAASTALRPASGERLAADVAAEFAQPTQALANRYRGQRIKLLGRVVDAQNSDEGIWLISLDAAPSPKPLRLVMAVGKLADTEAFRKGQTSVFDCLHGGIMLGEPLLSDCQVLRR